jgi:hypothetical protein
MGMMEHNVQIAPVAVLSAVLYSVIGAPVATGAQSTTATKTRVNMATAR